MTTTQPAPNNTPTPAPAPAFPGADGTERGIATATTLAPLVAGITAPFLNTDAATAVDIAYLAAAGILTTNLMDALPTDRIPAGDILRAHRFPLFVSTLTSGIALGIGTLTGPAGTDALLAGFFEPLSLPGIVSLGWWAATAIVPLQLRNVLRRRRHTPAAMATDGPAAPAYPDMPLVPPTAATQIAALWGQYVSHPTGSHRGQTLTIHPADVTSTLWRATITAPAGQAVTVTRETVSSVYQIPVDWITIRTGAHTGQARITVNLVAPPDLDTSTLQGAWKKWVSRPGGLMEGTHLTQITDDPNTGGQVALVIAGDTLDQLTHPDRKSLAGALRAKSPLLVSYEPRQNPREAVIRKMEHNPLQKGAAFPGLHVLTPNKNGYIQLGPGVSGFPARIQLWDPAMGAQHCIVCGVTGSGKGGTLQLIALAHHINGSAIIYGDPKGSSNPAITKMAAYAGLGPDAALGALRIWWHGLMHRVNQSSQAEMKNFKPSKDLPWAPLILDEASKLLGENAEHRKEATFIINAGATLGRSMGMPVILANQLMQLKEFGGDAAIRDNVFYGGSLILLRSDSQQKHLIDLPENFAGCNPADIPAAWSGDRDMVFDSTKPLNDPERTFGLGFAASPGAHAEMMRNWLLEDATRYIDTANIAHPADWPFWDDRHTLTEQSVLPSDQQTTDDDSTLPFPGFEAPKKPATAEDKILQALKDRTDPLGLEAIYTGKDTIRVLTQIEGSTLDNTITRLVKAGKIHRPLDEHGREVRGQFAIGPAPQPTTGDEAA